MNDAARRKLARRIAALPPTVFQNEIADNGSSDAWTPQSDTWNARSMRETSNFVDLPSTARNEASTSKWVPVAPAQPVDGVAADEPAGEVEPTRAEAAGANGRPSASALRLR